MARGARIEFSFYGDVQFSRQMNRMSERATSLKPVFEHIADRMEGWEKQQFDSQGGRASGGWAPLKPATLAAKRARGLDTRIMHATHRLRNALTESFADGAVRKITDYEMEFGVDDGAIPYAGAHQNPSSGSNLPRRRVIEFTEADRREIVKDLQLFVLRGELRA